MQCNPHPRWLPATAVPGLQVGFQAPTRAYSKISTTKMDQLCSAVASSAVACLMSPRALHGQPSVWLASCRTARLLCVFPTGAFAPSSADTAAGRRPRLLALGRSAVATLHSPMVSDLGYLQ